MAAQEPDEARVRHMRDLETLNRNVAYVRDFLSRKRLGGNLLDLGCGNARFTTGVADLFERVVAVDISDKMIRRCANPSPNIDFLIGSATHLPLRSDSFDNIMSLAMIHSFGEKNLERAMAEIGRCAKKRSFLFVTFSQLRRGQARSVRRLMKEARFTVRQSLPSRMGIVKFTRIWGYRG